MLRRREKPRSAMTPGPAVPRRLLVPDLPISSPDEDALGHRDVATLLGRVLLDWLPRSEPLHVALYGPWGGGKSGIISLLKNEIERDEELKASVHLLSFSLWRFGAENVRRGLLLFLDGSDGLRTNTGMVERLSRSSARTEVHASISWVRFFKWLLVSFACIGLYVFLLPDVTPQSSVVHRLFVELVKLGIVLPVALGALLGLARLDLQTQVTEGTTKPPPDRPDQFKTEFESLLARARSRGTSDGERSWTRPQKLVLVFDDLDRVPPSIAWDVLTTVKTFMDSPHCVYVVPCDRDAVLDAMKSESGPHLEARAIDFLDKFFQVSFNLPETYPREARQITDDVCGQLGLPREVRPLAVAGFSRTPRALKVFLNQVSLLAEFISVRNDRMGELGSPGFLPKVAKVHAVRVLWPGCGRALAEMPALMAILEQLAQGIQAQEGSDVAGLASRFVTPGSKEYCNGLKQFLVATLGIVVGNEAQSAIKLSEAIWAEARGDLDNMRTYLSTGDTEGVRRLFEKADVARAVGFARDAFDSESQTAAPETLVGWTGVLLQAFFDGRSGDVPEDVVALSTAWASSPIVTPFLDKLPPDALVRAIASTDEYQALTVGQRLVDLAFAVQADPLPDYTVTVLRALAANRTQLSQRHADLGKRIRTKLGQMVGENRQQVVLRLSALGQGIAGSEWGLWWDSTLGSLLIKSISGLGNATEHGKIRDLVARSGYEPSREERQAATQTSASLFRQSNSSSFDGTTDLALGLMNRVSLVGEPWPLLDNADAEACAAFVARLGDPDQKLTALLPVIRLAGPSLTAAKQTVSEKGLQPALASFTSPHLEKVFAVLADVGLSGEEIWIAGLLRRSVELRDANLFSAFAEKSRNAAATASGLETALKIDQAFGDSLLARNQPSCDPQTFARVLEQRVISTGADVASTVRLINVVQALAQKPELQDSTWHTVATRIEQGVMDFSDSSSAQALRRAVSQTLLTWLPDPDQRHLADFATAVVRGAQGQPNDPAETTQAKAEAGLVFESICTESQAAIIANGVGHVLAWPTLAPTVVSQLVTALTSRPRLLALIKNDALEAIALTRDTRTDEGQAFLNTLLQARPPAPKAGKVTKEKKQ